MNTSAVLVLLGFAAWTLLTLFGSVGLYRWSPHPHRTRLDS